MLDVDAALRGEVSAALVAWKVVPKLKGAPAYLVRDALAERLKVRKIHWRMPKNGKGNPEALDRQLRSLVHRLLELDALPAAREAEARLILTIYRLAVTGGEAAAAYRARIPRLTRGEQGRS